MCVYLTKSKQNIKCADMMLAKGLPMAVASSHSAYYSVFQMMKYVLAQFMGVSYEQQIVITQNKGSHNSLFNIFKVVLRKTIKDSTVFNCVMSLFNKTKMMRQTCDYGSLIYSQDQLNENVKNAKEFSLKLSNIYNFTI